MSSQKKIVLLTDCLAYLTGGAERQIFELARGLDKKKYSVTIASLECEGSAPRDIIESAGCHLVVFPVKRIYGLSGIREGFRFIRFLRRNRTDILMTYHFSSDIWGTVTAKIARVRAVISNRRDMGFWRGRRHIQAYKMINRFVNRIVVNARAIKMLFTREENIAERKIEVIHNGIDLKSAGNGTQDAPLRKDLNIKDTETVIIHVANMTLVKGHDFLLKAFKETLKVNSGVKLLIVGADEMNGSVEGMVEQLQIRDSVFFLGEREDVSQLLRISDICVLPSLSEGMSNAIMEYMAAGKPVIATNVGGNPELVNDKVTGLLVEKGNADSLKKALLALIENPTKRASMGEKGFRKITNEFSTRQMVSSYEKLFESLVSGKRKILHLISSSGLFGAENIALTLGHNIQDGETCSLIGAFQNSQNERIEIITLAGELGIGTYTLKCGGRFDFRAVFRLKRYLVENKVDILHTHNYKSDIIGALAARLAGIPVVATAHGFTDMDRSVSAYEKLDRCFLKLFFKTVITVTGRMLPGFPKHKKRVIPNGIDITRFARDEQKRAALRKKFRIGENDILIGTVGRLSREKNQKMFLEAVYPIVRNHENVKVMIVGGGPKETELRQFRTARHLAGRIIFTGIIHDTVSAYSAMDIFVLSSLTEGVPLTILEAMASKIPVIATRVGGIPRIIEDGKTGLLVDPGDTSALRDNIEDLVKNKDKRRQLTKSAFDFVKINHSLDHMCDAYKKVYQEVLG